MNSETDLSQKADMHGILPLPLENTYTLLENGFYFIFVARNVISVTLIISELFYI